MPTYDAPPVFLNAHSKLTAEQKQAFREAVDKFVEDLAAGDGFRASLRVKGVRLLEGVYEMTWAQNGRAMFKYGASVDGDEPHVIWVHVGDHKILP